MWKIPLADVQFGADEITAVTDVLKSGWLSQGPRVERFEAALAEYLGVKHAIAVANGTAALHLACLALDLGPGDEVLCPALTFVATANAIGYTGARPVFVDIGGPRDLNISRRRLPRPRSPPAPGPSCWCTTPAFRWIWPPSRPWPSATAWPSSKTAPMPRARSIPHPPAATRSAPWGPWPASASFPIKT